MADYAKQPRRKQCQFCKDGVEFVDYKDTQMLRKYTTDRGKIKPRRVTGACNQHQRDIAKELALWLSSRTRFRPSVAVAIVAATAREVHHEGYLA